MRVSRKSEYRFGFVMSECVLSGELRGFHTAITRDGGWMVRCGGGEVCLCVYVVMMEADADDERDYVVHEAVCTQRGAAGPW